VTRVLVVAPRLGATIAVLAESPLILTASWFACAWCLRRFEIPPRGRERLAMGLLAFLLLMVVEAGLAVLAFGQTPAAWLAAFHTAPGAIGLLAQVAFGLVPVVQRSRPAS
jgi:hypothetical protein